METQFQEWDPGRRLNEKLKRGIRKRVILVSAAVLVVGISALMYFVLSKGPVRAPAMTRTQLTFSGNVALAEISPDGKSIAYVEDGSRVFVQDIAAGKPIEVLKAQAIETMRWAPGGTEVAVVAWVDSSPATFVLPRFGGTSRRFDFDASAISWSPNGSSIAATIENKKRVDFLKISEKGDFAGFPLGERFMPWGEVDWSPVGGVIAIGYSDSLLGRYGIMASSEDGSRQAVVVEDSVEHDGTRWASHGDALYYLRGRTPSQDLFKIAIDPENGEPKGSPQRIQSGLGTSGRFSVSKDGRRLVYAWLQKYRNVWSAMYAEAGSEKIAEEKQITVGTSDIGGVRISPDGRKITYSKGGTSSKDLFVSSVLGGEERQLTFGEKIARMAWSPDGKEIAYISSRGESPKLWVIGADGSGARTVGKKPPSYDLTWAPGRFILYQVRYNQNFQILDPLTGEERPLVGNDDVGWMFQPRYSPDGNRIAVSWNRMHKGRIGLAGIWLLSLQDTTQYLLEENLGQPLTWSADGKRILFRHWQDLRTVVSISVATRKKEQILTLQNKSAMVSDLNTVARKIVWVVEQKNADAWLIENFDPEVE